MNKIIIIGHKSPDLDAIASTIIYAEYLKKNLNYSNFEIIPASSDKPNLETKYVFETFNIDLPIAIDKIKITENDMFILVDHNEESQRHEAVENHKILEVVDHHKVNVNFPKPVKIDVKPLGCTAAVIYDHFLKNNIEASKEVKSLVLSAILSDTVALKSPTTTGIDSKIANDLCDELGLELEDFAFKMFKAKSSVSHLSTEEIVKGDYKIFEFGNKKAFVGVLETVEQDSLLSKTEEFKGVLNKIKENEKVDYAFFAIVDILKVNSKVIFDTNEEAKILEDAFVAERENGIVDIGPKISRKKEIAPALEETIKNL